MPHDQVEIILLDKDTQQQIKSYEEMGKTIYLLLTLTFGQETWYVNSHFLTHAVENVVPVKKLEIKKSKSSIVLCINS